MLSFVLASIILSRYKKKSQVVNKHNMFHLATVIRIFFAKQFSVAVYFKLPSSEVLMTKAYAFLISLPVLYIMLQERYIKAYRLQSTSLIDKKEEVKLQQASLFLII